MQVRHTTCGCCIRSVVHISCLELSMSCMRSERCCCKSDASLSLSNFSNARHKLRTSSATKKTQHIKIHFNTIHNKRITVYNMLKNGETVCSCSLKLKIRIQSVSWLPISIYLFSRLYNVSTYSCANLTVI